MGIALLQDKTPDLPPASRANSEGLVAVGGKLTVERLLQAYRSGIFPWTTEPVTWWSPEPRAILPLDGMHVSQSLAKKLKKNPFTITFDTAFSRVMEECAHPRPGRMETWISPEFIKAYSELYQAGHAHSVECWNGNDLVGGVYGVHVGGLFAGESMFHKESDASKIALFHLFTHLQANQFKLFDIQTLTNVTRQLGGKEIPRSKYLRLLEGAVATSCAF